MSPVRLPFNLSEGETGHDDNLHGDNPYECGLFRTLPPTMQELCRVNTHVMEYLHLLPIDEIGVPQYFPELSKKVGELKTRNLLYPVSDDVIIHVWSGAGEERDIYIPVEPSLVVQLTGKLAEVETRLLEFAASFAHAETDEERRQALLAALNKICLVANAAPHPSRFNLFKRKAGVKVLVTPREFQAIKYLVLRDKVGLGLLEPFIRDTYIEDISCSGVGHIFLEHKVFNSMKSAVSFDTHKELDDYVLRLSELIRRPVTMRRPIVDATLPDGSRINIVYGKEVSQRGSNFTIRRFSETPLSIMQLIEFGTLNYHMAAYISLILEGGMNTFVAGETASGKTTLINAITTFISPSAKVVSIEDTPEVQVPHPNWIREVAKPANAEEGSAGVTMMDLLKAALRQRPNLIIIGEIRGEEGAVAFQAMQTGHAVMATFHAASVEKLIQRLTGNPINVPKTYIDNLNVVIIMSAVKLANGKVARRVISVSEIVGYDPPSNTFSIVEIFRWNPVGDVFDFVGDKNSYLLEEKIAPMRGLAGANKWAIYSLLDKRATVLRKLHTGKGVTGYYELLRVLARAQQEGLF